ncbi:MAG: hypothetical protein IPM29_12725 [Planctomycetes bacterium]|nr:hypothetical protein [Planctomycetota bacterium]
MTPLRAVPDGSDLRFELPADSWFTELRLLRIDGSSDERTSGDGESLLVVLDGTFDLFAGGGSWLRRGLRATPTAGRAVALFLPPHTRFRAEHGSGRLLLVSARRPEPPRPDAAATPAAKKPLLQLAGSGKSFDSASQQWRPTESFLGSPEALLPRRFERIALADEVVLERIAGPDYKALSLRVDECALPAGARVESFPHPASASCRPPLEALAVVVTDGAAMLGDGAQPCAGTSAHHAPDGTLASLAALAEPCYALLAYAGPKLPPTT